MTKSKRDKNKFETGINLEPLESLDLNKIDDFDQVLSAMAKTSFGGRQLGNAAEILTEMFTDPDDLTVLTLSGALTVAKQGLIITELIERKLVDIVVSTGALITHGLIDGMDFKHYKAPAESDAELYKRGMCRVYDTIELEVSFGELQKLIGDNLKTLMPASFGDDKPDGSAGFLKRLGKLIAENYPDQRGILSAAYNADIPVYIPAFTDCELSLDLMIRGLATEKSFLDKPFEKMITPAFNPFVDLFDYAKRVYNHKGSMSVFTLGGGVPRNWAQQITPLFDIMCLEDLPVEPKIFSKGIRICPEPVHWGGLSGCTYQEGISWAKFLPESEGGKYAEVMSDATTVLPILIKGVLQRIGKKS